MIIDAIRVTIAILDTKCKKDSKILINVTFCGKSAQAKGTMKRRKQPTPNTWVCKLRERQGEKKKETMNICRKSDVREGKEMDARVPW